MKLLIIIKAVLSLSCKKQQGNCYCGEIIEMFNREIAVGNLINYQSKYILVVENKCSGNTKKLKTN